MPWKNNMFSYFYISLIICIFLGCILAGTLKGYDLEKRFWVVLASMFAMASFCLAMAWNRIKLKSKNDFAGLKGS